MYDIPPDLDVIVRSIALNGVIMYDWALVRKLIQIKLCKVGVSEFHCDM